MPPVVTIEPGLPCAQAVNPASFVRLAFEGVDLAPLIHDRLEALGAGEGDPARLLELGSLFQLVNERDRAMLCQTAALQSCRLYHYPAADARPLRLLALVTAGDLMTNTPFELMLEGRPVDITKLYLSADQPLPARAPEHDLAIMAVSESGETGPLLEQLRAIEGRWPRPIVNTASRVLDLARERLHLRLAGAPGLSIPATGAVSRADLLAAASAGDLGRVLPAGGFPIIIRPVGSHAGKALNRIEDWAALAAYLDQVTGDQFYISRFIDYRSADGRFRKYRIAFFAGAPFLCHMAISDNWMVHYLNAGMAEDEAKRAEERAVMEGFDTDFARRHATGFESLAERIGLDYFAVDCAELPDGDLLVFEADVAMIIHDLDPEALYPYKKTQMRKVFDAFEAFLRAAASGGVRSSD